LNALPSPIVTVVGRLNPDFAFSAVIQAPHFTEKSLEMIVLTCLRAEAHFSRSRAKSLLDVGSHEEREEI
jgi:hypothetical protein